MNVKDLLDYNPYPNSIFSSGLLNMDLLSGRGIDGGRETHCEQDRDILAFANAKGHDIESAKYKATRGGIFIAENRRNG
jgi:hypothetical protein